jgi:hypothetical protein
MISRPAPVLEVGAVASCVATPSGIFRPQRRDPRACRMGKGLCQREFMFHLAERDTKDHFKCPYKIWDIHRTLKRDKQRFTVHHIKMKKIKIKIMISKYK